MNELAAPVRAGGRRRAVFAPSLGPIGAALALTTGTTGLLAVGLLV